MDPDQRADDEVAILQKKFEVALAALRKSASKRFFGGRWLYQLPWFLIIGRSGCGKSTLIKGSGLRFALSGDEPVGGVGGTRDCDWWFTQQAVLLDTAGRYATQDSYERVDQAAWLGLLDLLRRNRPRRPINGSLVAVSLSALITQSASERAADARAIRKRIKELHERLRIRFPVYLLFTKADLVGGFIEYFDDLSEEERAQVWGMTFPEEYLAEGRSAIALYGQELDLLVQRLDERRLDLVQEGVDVGQRALAFRFPQQFASLREITEAFLRDIFDPSPLETQAMLRGVYFTSGTQQGTPIDRVLFELARGCGLDARAADVAVAGQPRSYFINRLVNDLIFPEAALAGTDPQQERRRRWQQRLAYGGALVIAAGAAIVWVNSYRLNKEYIDTVAAQADEIHQQLEALPADNDDIPRLLPTLNALRNLPGGYADSDTSRSLARNFGLDQTDKLGGEARSAYDEILRQSLLPLIVRDLGGLVRDSQTDRERLYEALRLYLLFQHPVHYQANAPALRAWVRENFSRRFAGTMMPSEFAELDSHADALLASFPGTVAPDRKLVDDAREVIKSIPVDKRVYARLTSEGPDPALDLPDFIPSKPAGEFGHRLFRRHGVDMDSPIPALFTYRGYFEGFKPKLDAILAEMATESWVVGEDSDLAGEPEASDRIKEKVRRRYLEDYQHRWVELIHDIHVIPLSAPGQASDVLHKLTLETSSGVPLRNLIHANAGQTRLDQAPPIPSPNDGDEAAADPGRVERTLRALGGDGLRSVSMQSNEPVAEVVERFAEIQEYAPGGGETSALLNDLLENLRALAEYMHEVDRSMKREQWFLQTVTSDTTPVDNAKRAISDMPPKLKSWLVDIPDACRRMISEGFKTQLNQIWASDEYLPTCRRITGWYPMNRGSPVDTPLEDFGRVFGPTGLMETFFGDHLKDKVATTAGGWRAIDPELDVSANALAQFKIARDMRNAFFGSGADDPLLKFDLQPFDLSGNARGVFLNIDGQSVRYEQGPTTKSYPITWPGPEPGQVRVELDAAGEVVSPKSYNGSWALFKLLDHSALSRSGPSPTDYRVTFSFGPYEAVFDVRAHRSVNAFDFEAWRSFHCPESL